jgi:hypothetical protein
MTSHELARRLLELPDVQAVVADGCCALIPAITRARHFKSREEARRDLEHYAGVHLNGQLVWPVVFID